VVLDLKLPDMSGFEILERIRDDDSLRDLPVVVFTGRQLSADEDARLHTMARRVVVKGVESPERLLDETALFLHRVVADLPPWRCPDCANGCAACNRTRTWWSAQPSRPPSLGPRILPRLAPPDIAVDLTRQEPRANVVHREDTGTK
jgi:DNA-binding response OmpR family regulator